MEKRIKIQLGITTGFFFLSSAPMLFLPLADFNGSQAQVAAGYICGLTFWIGLVLGIGGYILTLVQVKRMVAEDAEGRRPGVFRFFSNRVARICDVVFIGCIVIAIISFVYTGMNQYIVLTDIFLLLFSFHMHWICNGKIFRYLINSN